MKNWIVSLLFSFYVLYKLFLASRFQSKKNQILVMVAVLHKASDERRIHLRDLAPG